MSNKLSDWLPILQHPEVGERICEAVGCRLQKDSEGVSVTELWFPGYGGLAKSSHLGGWQLSALAFGTLAVLSINAYSEINEYQGEWSICLGPRDPDGPWADTFPEAVLECAKRVWL